MATNKQRKSLEAAAGAKESKPSLQKKPAKGSSREGRKLAPGTESSYPTPHPAVRRAGVRSRGRG